MQLEMLSRIQDIELFCIASNNIGTYILKNIYVSHCKAVNIPLRLSKSDEDLVEVSVGNLQHSYLPLILTIQDVLTK